MDLIFSNQLFNENLAGALGRTFVHSLWLGLLAAIAAGIVVTCTPRTTARHRYNLLGAVFVIFLVSVGIVFYRQLEASNFNSPASLVPAITFVEETAHATDQGETVFALIFGFINKYAVFLFQVWAVFFLFRVVKLLAGMTAANRLKNARIVAVEESWIQKLEVLQRELGISRAARLVQSEIIKVPMAIGWLKPVILLPAGLLSQLPPPQVEAILLHELAHIRRNDYFMNILQLIAECFFFFNPAILWLSSLIRQERESCCDEMVLGVRPQHEYVNALVAFQEYQFQFIPAALTFSTKKEYLLNRVRKILTSENKKLNMIEKLGLLSGLIIFCAFTFAGKGSSKPAVDNPSQVSRVSLLPSLSYALYNADTSPVRKQNAPKTRTARENSGKIPFHPKRERKSEASLQEKHLLSEARMEKKHEVREFRDVPRKHHVKDSVLSNNHHDVLKEKEHEGKQRECSKCAKNVETKRGKLFNASRNRKSNLFEKKELEIGKSKSSLFAKRRASKSVLFSSKPSRIGKSSKDKEEEKENPSSKPPG